jgi:hypothetical protein
MKTGAMRRGTERKGSRSRRGVALKFDPALVRRLVDHVRTSERFLPYYGGTRAEPALWLVGDGGVYLMSNGLPAMDVNGNLIPENAKDVRRLTAYAVGCNPDCDVFDDWWAVHNAIAGGDDFVQMLSVEDFERVLPSCREHVVVVATDAECEVCSDIEGAGWTLVRMSLRRASRWQIGRAGGRRHFRHRPRGVSRVEFSVGEIVKDDFAHPALASA